MVDTSRRKEGQVAERAAQKATVRLRFPRVNDVRDGKSTVINASGKNHGIIISRLNRLPKIIAAQSGSNTTNFFY